jgi:hypothetical protein
MAGSLTISTLKDSSGVLATQNGMTGIAKAWVRFSVSGTTVTVNGSFNMSSVTRDSTGNYTFALTTAMPNANYSVVPAMGGIDVAGGQYTASNPFCIAASPFYALPTTTTFNVAYTAANLSTRADPLTTSVAIFST